MAGAQQVPEIVVGDGWYARYRHDGDDAETPFFHEPVLFFTVTVYPRRACRVVGYVADEETNTFRPATFWSNFEGFTK